MNSELTLSNSLNFSSTEVDDMKNVNVIMPSM